MHRSWGLRIRAKRNKTLGFWSQIRDGSPYSYEVKAKAGHDADLSVFTADGREFTLYKFLEAQAGDDY